MILKKQTSPKVNPIGKYQSIRDIARRDLHRVGNVSTLHNVSLNNICIQICGYGLEPKSKWWHNWPIGEFGIDDRINERGWEAESRKYPIASNGILRLIFKYNKAVATTIYGEDEVKRVINYYNNKKSYDTYMIRWADKGIDAKL